MREVSGLLVDADEDTTSVADDDPFGGVPFVTVAAILGAREVPFVAVDAPDSDSASGAIAPAAASPVASFFSFTSSFVSTFASFSLATIALLVEADPVVDGTDAPALPSLLG